MLDLIKTLALIAPLGTAAVAVASPGRELDVRDTPSACTSVSSGEDFAWTIDTLSYRVSEIYTTPAHLVASASVDFKVDNPATLENVHCYATSSAYTLYFYGTITYTCDVPPTGSSTNTKTYFTFSRINNQLTVNQTWTCSQELLTFKGNGAVVLPLQCQETYYVNPNYTSPSNGFYSTRTTTCTPLTLSLAPSDLTVTE